MRQHLALGWRVTISWRVFAFTLSLTGLLGWGMPVVAQEIVITGLSQEDLDGDGQPDLTIIETQFETDHDVVWVYDGADNMAWGEDWRLVTDFTDDTWLFDTLGDGSAQLVVQFFQYEQEVVARLFQDQDGDAAVDFSVAEGEVIITESEFPALTVIAEGDWFLSDGQLNWNVRFLTNGPSIIHRHTYELTDQWRTILKFDDLPDVELEFHDQDLDGIPEYGTWRVVAPTPSSWGAVRAWIWANTGRHRPTQPSGYLFWPYLTTSLTPIQTSGASQLVPAGAALPQEFRYFDVPPVVVVRPSGGRILEIRFPGYPIERGFHVRSFRSIQKGALNYVDSEIAQAYYDLANDQDGFPELHIRNRYYGPHDSYGWNLDTPVNEIRWSWNQANLESLTWDYKLGLAGRHLVSETVGFSDFSYYSVPYEELPYWVTERSWDYATFVAREAASFQSTEGIYMWGAVESVAEGEPSTLSRYLAGELETSVVEAFQQVPEGWRGEFGTLDDQPFLYFSPVDVKLHLRNAEQGVWNLGSSQIRYANLDGDAFLDHWMLTRDEELVEQLFFLDGLIVQERNDRVRIKSVDIGPALFEMLPPREDDERQVLARLLDDYRHEPDPDDFDSMYTQFEGPEWWVEGGRIRDIRVHGGGFRFVLELLPGFATFGSDGPDLTGLSPGRYVVTYHGNFSVLALTPPRPEIVPGTLRLGSSAPIVQEWQQVHAEFHNLGLEDLPSFWVQVYARDSGGVLQLVDATEIELLAGHSVSVKLEWLPTSPGEWEVILVGGDDLDTLSASTLDAASLSVDVYSPEPISLAEIWRISNASEPSTLLFLVSLGVAAATLALVSMRAREDAS